jgi:hypothetical protein
MRDPVILIPHLNTVWGRSVMVANLDMLFEAVDLSRIDRRLADRIEKDQTRINEEIERQGYSDVTVDGKTFRVKKRIAQAA